MELLFLAARTLLHRRGSFVLLLAAVTGAVGLQISNSANIDGYNREFFRVGIENIVGHLVVSSADSETIEEPRDALDRLRKLDGVAVVAPRFGQPGVLFRKARRHPVSALGMDPVVEQRATRFCDRLAVGRCPRRGGAELVVGQRIAAKLKIVVGDSVQLAMPVDDLDGIRIVKDRFAVVGILQPGGGFSVVEYGVFLPIEDLRELLGWKSAVTSLHVYLGDPGTAATMITRVASALDPGARVQHWSEVNPDGHATIAGTAMLNHVSQIMVILAVLVPTFALLWVNVLRERRQIAALAAIGFSRWSLFAVYLQRAALVGGLGSVLGSCLGLSLCRWFERHPLYSHHGLVITPDLTGANLALSVGLVFLVTVAGGVIPALHAAWSNPSLAMREA